MAVNDNDASLMCSTLIFDPITGRELTLFGKSHPDVKPLLCIVFDLIFLRVCSLFKGPI